MSCSDGFESGGGAWGAWWSGTTATVAGAPHTGSSSLRLDGSPGTAITTSVAQRCGGDVAAVRLWVRTTAGGEARIRLKIIDGAGSAHVVGPFVIGEAWAQLSVTSVGLAQFGSIATVGVEASPQGAGVVTFIDDVVFESSAPTTGPTTTSPTTTGPATTGPATTVTGPPTTVTTVAPNGSCSDDFETGTDGWVRWWSGITALSTAFAGRERARCRCVHR